MTDANLHLRQIKSMVNFQLGGLNCLQLRQLLCLFACLRMVETLWEYDTKIVTSEFDSVWNGINLLKRKIQTHELMSDVECELLSFASSWKAVDAISASASSRIIPQVACQVFISTSLLAKSLRDTVDRGLEDVLMNGASAVVWFLDSNSIRTRDRNGFHPLLTQELQVNEENKRALLIRGGGESTVDKLFLENRELGGLEKRLISLKKRNALPDQDELL